ncbi:MAG: hypothetical protein ACRD18_00315, partial [Terriglobia bacterium]
AMGGAPIAAAGDNANGDRLLARLKPCPSALLAEIFRADLMRLRRTTWDENDVGALLGAPNVRGPSKQRPYGGHRNPFIFNTAFDYFHSRCFVEFTLSLRRFFASLRMTAEGLSMTCRLVAARELR